MTIEKTYCCAQRMNVKFCDEWGALRFNHYDFSKDYFLLLSFFCKCLIDILGFTDPA